MFDIGDSVKLIENKRRGFIYQKSIPDSSGGYVIKIRYKDKHAHMYHNPRYYNPNLLVTTRLVIAEKVYEEIV